MISPGRHSPAETIQTYGADSMSQTWTYVLKRAALPA
jgi:hypothetical protein